MFEFRIFKTEQEPNEGEFYQKRELIELDESKENVGYAFPLFELKLWS